MKPAFLKIGILTLGLAALGIAITRQRHALERLRLDAAGLRATADEKNRLTAEHDKLLARQISPEELARLQVARAETDELRQAAKQLRNESGTKKETLIPEENPPPEATPKSATETWKNVGNATATTTFQTFLWAVTHDETEKLASLIAFDSKGRALANALFDRLPEELRARSGSPEAVFATLLAVRLPNELGTAHVASESREGDDMTLHVQLRGPRGGEKDAKFHFVEGTGGWRLVVPESIVENYQQMLADPPPRTLPATQ